MKIILHIEAEQDLNDTIEYYKNIDVGLAQKFVKYLDITFEKIVKFPNIYPYEIDNIQKVFMEKFPYVVLYEQYQGNIVIYAIFHTRRNPDNLKDRV